MAELGLEGSAGYTTSQLLRMGISKGFTPLGGEVKADTTFSDQTYLNNFKGGLEGGLDFLRSQREALKTSSDSLHRLMAESARMEPNESTALSVLRKDAEGAINQMKSIRDSRLHLIELAKTSKTPGMHLAEAEALAPLQTNAEFKARRVHIDVPPVDQSWGSREMYVKDADGKVMSLIISVPEELVLHKLG